MAWRTANFADPTCQFWLVFAGSPFRIFKKVRIILRPKFTNLNFRLPTIYVNRLTRKKPETLILHKILKIFPVSSVGSYIYIYIYIYICLIYRILSWDPARIFSGTLAGFSIRVIYKDHGDLKFYQSNLR